MPKYLDLEAHFETDLASLFGMKAPSHDSEENTEHGVKTDAQSNENACACRKQQRKR